jgi:sugar phosphate isomerase/epimerase
VTIPARPPIACSTVSVFTTPLHDAFPLFAETGFDGVEIMVTSDPDTQDAGRIADLTERHGLPVVAVHAPFLLMARRVFGADPIGKIDRSVELARAVGAPLVVVHPPYRWQPGYRRWLQEQLSEDESRGGIRVAVENMYPVRVRGRHLAGFHHVRTLEDLERFPNVVLDTSHAAVAGLDLVEATARLGGRLAHVHLSNNAGRGWDSHLPLDEGVLDLAGFLAALGASGFAGAISLEIDLRAHRNDPTTLRSTLVRSRRLCADRLTFSL